MQPPFILRADVQSPTERGDGHSAADGQDWQAVGEASVHPPLRREWPRSAREDSDRGLPREDTVLLRIRALGMNALELLLMRTSWIGFVLEAKQIFVCISFTHRLPRCLRGKEPACNAFDPWVGKMPWRRARQPTPGFLPGESHGQRSLVGCSPYTGSQRVSHNRSDLPHTHTHTHTGACYCTGNLESFLATETLGVLDL